MRYLLDDGNTIIADQDFIDAQYPGATVVVEAAQIVSLGDKVTRLAFRNRFTSAEKAALYTAANSSVQIKIYLDDLAAVTEVDLTHTATGDALQSLVTAGLLTAARRTAILTDPVQAIET